MGIMGLDLDGCGQSSVPGSIAQAGRRSPILELKVTSTRLSTNLSNLEDLYVTLHPETKKCASSVIQKLTTRTCEGMCGANVVEVTAMDSWMHSLGLKNDFLGRGHLQGYEPYHGAVDIGCNVASTPRPGYQ